MQVLRVSGLGVSGGSGFGVSGFCGFRGVQGLGLKVEALGFKAWESCV